MSSTEDAFLNDLLTPPHPKHDYLTRIPKHIYEERRKHLIDFLTSKDTLARLVHNPSDVEIDLVRLKREASECKLPPAASRKLVNEPDVDQLRRKVDEKAPWGASELLASQLLESHAMHADEGVRLALENTRLVNAFLRRTEDAALDVHQQDDDDEEELPITKRSGAIYDEWFARLTPSRKTWVKEYLRRRSFWEGAPFTTEDFFTLPDQPIGIFNRDLVNVWVDGQRRRHVEAMRRSGYDAAVIDQIQHKTFGINPPVMSARAEASKEKLWREGMMLPPAIPSGKGRKRRQRPSAAPVVRGPSPSANGQGRKRRASDEDPAVAPASEMQTPPSSRGSQTADSQATPPTTRSGRARKAPRRF